MSEDLDVKWLAARRWLDSIRRAAISIESLVREISALEDARDEMLGWRTKGTGPGTHGMGAHSDPTATAAEQRMCELDELIDAKRGELQRKIADVGACGDVLSAMAMSIGMGHAKAIELYYIDCAPTWSDVAYEMGVNVKRLYRLRIEAYAWIEARQGDIL